jgi:hypothetical protein
MLKHGSQAVNKEIIELKEKENLPENNNQGWKFWVFVAFILGTLIAVKLYN